jgi:hypothetical protein
MKAKNRIHPKSKRPESPPALPNTAQADELLDPPVVPRDIPDHLPAISQREIVEYQTAFQVYRLARTHFELKRAGIVMKLLQLRYCEEGSYFTFLDDEGNLIVEDHTSLAPVTRRPVIDRSIVPSCGAA